MSPVQVAARRVQSLIERPAFVPATLGLALLVRLVWMAWIDTPPSSDYLWYFEKGLSIAAGEGYTVRDDGFPLWEPGSPLAVPRPTAFWPVGYPAFLGALFWLTSGLVKPLLAAKLANCLLGVATAWITAGVTELLFDSKAAARIALVLTGFAPNFVAYATLTSTETYFTFLTCAGVYLMLRAELRTDGSSSRVPSLAGGGLLFGLAILTKPQAGPLPLLLTLLLSRGRLRHTLHSLAWVYGPAALLVLPWVVRNYYALHAFVPVSTNGWINLAIGNMPGSWGGNGLMWNQALHDVVTQHHDEMSWNREAKRVVLDYVASHPGSVLLHLFKKLGLLYASDVDGFGWHRATRPDALFWTPLRALAQLWYMVGVGACLVFFARLRRGVQLVQLVPPVIILYYTALYTVFFGGPRFHFPVMPWVYACASLPLAQWLVRGTWRSERDTVGHAPQ